MTLHALQLSMQDWLRTESSEAAARFEARVRNGLDVYLNNYRAQLMACLEASYPAVRAWIGESGFERAAATHVEHSPPSSWTLDDYGADFANTLAVLYPGDAEITELAALERALGTAFTGADAATLDESEPGMSALASIDWDDAVIHLVPTFRLIPVTTNAGAIWSAIQSGNEPPPALNLPVPGAVAVWRTGSSPTFRTIDAEEAAVLSRVLEGWTFGEICAELVECTSAEAGPQRAGALLANWLSDRSIAHIDTTSQ